MISTLRNAVLGVVLTLPLLALWLLIVDTGVRRLRDIDYYVKFAGFRIEDVYVEYAFYAGVALLLAQICLLWPRLALTAVDGGLKGAAKLVYSQRILAVLFTSATGSILLAVLATLVFFFWNEYVFNHSRDGLLIFRIDDGIVVFSIAAIVFATRLWQICWPELPTSRGGRLRWSVRILFLFAMVYVYRLSFHWFGNLEDFAILMPLIVYIFHILLLLLSSPATDAADR